MSNATSSGGSASTGGVGYQYDVPGQGGRTPVLARQAAATSHPLAAQAALFVLERGGNAVDAAIAAATTACVVEPTMNGLGGDLFALVWDGTRLHGLNASGRAPLAWSPERFAGRAHVPELGWEAVTVPGGVSGWVALWERFCTLPFEKLLEPAVNYAREGFPVMPHIARLWGNAARRFAEFGEFRRVFLPEGRAPRAGEWFKLPDLADSLEDIATTRGRSFYSGELARRIVSDAQQAGAALREADLAAHQADWVEPIAVPAYGNTVHELPPNGQGLAALIALGVLAHLDLPAEPNHPQSIHLQLEAMKVAFADCTRYVGDPLFSDVPVAHLLDPQRLATLAKRIKGRAAPPRPRPMPDHGTVYLTTADREGRMVSLIQSNYLGFGSGIVIPGTGIALHNRGLGFSLNPERANAVRGGARPYHTIMPGFVTREAQPVLSFGVMGGHMQPQGHVQLVLRCLLWGENPQRACEAPRWYIHDDDSVALEPGLLESAGDELIGRGHRLQRAPAIELFGGAQAIARVPGGYCAATDPRKDGQAVGS